MQTSRPFARVRNKARLQRLAGNIGMRTPKMAQAELLDALSHMTDVCSSDTGHPQCSIERGFQEH